MLFVFHLLSQLSINIGESNKLKFLAGTSLREEKRSIIKSYKTRVNHSIRAFNMWRTSYR